MLRLLSRRKSSLTKFLAQETVNVMAVPSTSIDGKEAMAFSILDHAVELDNQRRFTEATVCYEEGLQLLIDVIKASKVPSTRSSLREKALHYMDRAEKVKETCKQQQQQPPLPTVKVEVTEASDFYEPSDTKTSNGTRSKRHQVINIANNSTGHSYEKLFGEYLNHEVITVTVKDPYIRSIHQIYNFLRFSELLVKSCRNLRAIRLVTTLDTDENQQKVRLYDIVNSLAERNVELTIEYSPTLHDREIRLSSGWLIKIGRGLDMYKPTRSKFSIGFCDFDLRQCHETTVDIYSTDNLVQFS